jgi:broad specificity phosphatase PhoE
MPRAIVRGMAELTLYLCRHGDTEWSGYRRLAGRTDLPLVEHGEQNARRLGERLRNVSFERVLVSPLRRARRTVELALPSVAAVVDERLLEMSFGRYEGRTVEEIRTEQPGWTYLRDCCPGGESPEDIGRRADALLAEVEPLRGNIALFAHSVILRVIAARYLGLPAGAGRSFMLSPGALCVLGYDVVDESRAIAAWNDRAHLGE